ncbi:c-type cytochrome [Photobacterium minamisatsumaniensis]|uniref:c-type cytochrome n=1 Tax=Photobacterium minamisatsumaniensis TaxID=2910233 RepID=UPI003D0AE3D9
MKTIAAYSIGIIIISASGFFGLKTYTNSQFGEPNLANGKAHFANNCAVCHGNKGLGNGVMANNLAVSPDNIYEELTNPFGFKSELISSVLSGDNGQNGLMPAFKGILSEKDINDIFGYIESIN